MFSRNNNNVARPCGHCIGAAALGDSVAMIDDDAVSELIGRAYDTVADPGAWGVLLDALRTTLGGAESIFVVTDKATGTSSIGGTGAEGSAWRDYEAYYHQRDIWMQASSGLPNGRTFTGDDIVEREVLLSSEFYNDFLRRYDLNDILACITVNTEDHLGFVSVYRSPQSELFGEEERRLMEALAPHLSRAKQIGIRLSGLESLRQASTAAMDALPSGAIFLDGAGRVIWANAYARRLLESGDGIRLDGDRPAATDSEDRGLLDALLLRTVQGGVKAQGRGGRTVISRPLGRSALDVAIMPVSADGVLVPAGLRAAAVMMVTELGGANGTDVDSLARRFGLTSREARLASAVTAGTSLVDYAESTGVSMNTVRWHLRNLFEKTGSASQADLVRRILSAPPGRIRTESPTKS